MPEASFGPGHVARERGRAPPPSPLASRIGCRPGKANTGLSTDAIIEHQYRDFPRVRAMLRRGAWRALTDAFADGIKAAELTFRATPQSFVAFLQQRETLGIDPPWLAELAHHECVEHMLERADPPVADVGADGDLLDGIPLLGLVMPLAYRWPVDLIGPGWVPAGKPGVPTLLLARKDDRGPVRSGRVSRFEHALLVSLSANRWTGRQHLIALARRISGDPVQVLAMGHALLEQLRRDGIVLGAVAGQ